MNVLLVSTNRANQPMAVIPYGACMVAEAIARKGHRVSLLDLMFEPNPLRAVASALEKRRPDVVALSVRNIDNNDMQDTAEYYLDLPPIIETIRKKSAAPIVLGGAALGVMPEALLRCSGADLAVLGDGETVFPRVLEELSGNLPRSALQNVAWIEDNVYRQTRDSAAALDCDLMAPDFRRWVDIRAYRSGMATIPLQTKRGCPFECVYCTYGICEGKNYRIHPPAAVAEAVSRLAAGGLRSIEFVDNVFNAPYDHAVGICEELARKPSGARLLSMEINPGHVDDPLIESMERAGFAAIGITAESADDRVLARLGKGYDASHVQRTADVVRRHKLPCFWIFMLGGPGETRDSVLRTLRFAEKALRPHDVAFFNLGIRIYPGTPLERIAGEEGALRATGAQLLKPAFYFSPEVEIEWVVEQLRRTTGTHMNMLNTASLSHPWLPAINRLANRLPIGWPLWKHTGTVRKIVRFFGMDIWSTRKSREKQSD